MVSFQQQPTHTTREPFLMVDGDLSPGTYRFQLVVEDALGNRSLPDEQEVTVLRSGVVPRPPVLLPRPGRPVVDNPPPSL
ncbi:hypothetical protein ACQ4M4_21835 [Leptolyngbya sp. AN02str]|uniref:hypothetical protein n=1 Tax=Leptolyngbya sp. AN02str TaxID=3423363 RepID=UPI003D31272F